MDIPSELLQKIASGDCVVYVGAGLSRGAELPDWPQLLKQMISWSEANGVSLPHKVDIENAISERKFLLAAEEITEKMGDEKFRLFMSEVFRRPGLKPTIAHELLTQIPFAASLTSNYDKLLETAYIIASGGASLHVFSQRDVPELSNALRTKEFYVLKAHGTVDRIETIVLSRTQYRELMHNNPAYKQFLSSLLSTKTVLFIGFSLSDPDLELVLNELQSAFAGYTGTHYALMDISNMPAFERNRWATDYHIEIITYTPSAGDHPEVREFLQEIKKALPKHILWQTMTRTLEPAKKILNSDPHYRLVMNTNNEFVLEEQYEGAAKDKPLVGSMQFRFDPAKPEDREAHEALKRHLATGEEVTIKSPHLAEFIPPEVLSTLMPDQLESMEVTIGSVAGERPLPIKLIIEPEGGESVAVDNIVLKIVQRGTEQMILSNEHQTIPWKVRQTVRFKENESIFTINFSDIGLNVKQALDGWRVFDALSKGGQFHIESSETGKQLGHGHLEPGSYQQPDPRLLEVLEALTFIQSKTPALFETPARISVEEATAIFSVVQVLKTGVGEFNAAPFPLESKLEQAITSYERFKGGETATVHNYIDGYGIDILGQSIYLGPVVLSCKVHISPSDLEELRKSLESAQDKTYKIQLTPTPDALQEGKFIDWLPKDEAEKVRSLPFVRSNSLQTFIRMLFEATERNDGTVDIDQLISLLIAAKLEKSDDGTPLNLLNECTSDELLEAIKPMFPMISQKEGLLLATELYEKGWVAAAKAAQLAGVDEIIILDGKSRV